MTNLLIKKLDDHRNLMNFLKDQNSDGNNSVDYEIPKNQMTMEFL